MTIHIINSCTRKERTITLSCFYNFFSSMPLTLESPTIAQVPEGQWNSFLVAAVWFMFSFLTYGSLNCFVFSLFLVFSKDGDLQPVFRRYWWCFSSLVIFMIIDAHIWNFGGSSIHISGFDYRVFWVTCAARWLAITCFVSNIKVPFPLPPLHQIAAFILKYIIIKKFLIISFLVEISGLRNSISISRLVINFLSTTVWY